MLQLNPPLPVLTPKGPGVAHFLIDYGPEFDLYWTVFLDANGECWTFANRAIRACKNITLGRLNVEPPSKPSDKDDVSRRLNGSTPHTTHAAT